MKFARRAEGIKSARQIFKKAREDIRSRYHVFVAAALMEYYCSKDKDIAFRIFELGLKRFGGSPEFVMSYIDYLSHLNGTADPILLLTLFNEVFVLQRTITLECYSKEYCHPVDLHRSYQWKFGIGFWNLSQILVICLVL